MKILIVGGGGREHALAWKLAHDSRAPELFCAPGNAGTAGLARNLHIGAEDLDGLVAWAVRERPDLTVVGPEAPLCAGLADRLTAEGLRVFGPSAEAARMEGSKVFAKDIMESAGVPTARVRAFTEPGPARDYLREHGAPVVVKADGLAAGKGVFVCDSVADADRAVDSIMVDCSLGEAGRTVIVEDYLSGEEASILALVDGENVLMLAGSQDHKRIFDGDRGPNTGGMGAYSPAPVLTADLWPVIRKQVFEPVLAELRRRGIVYRGVLYAGLMIDAGVPSVLEFNCRFGDPETQAVLARIDGDLLPALEACVDGTLDDGLVAWRDEAAVCVVMASDGYPGAYEKGKPISGLENVSGMQDVVVFHAGTAMADGQVLTSGGRVLGVTALGTDLRAALVRAYEAVAGIEFEGARYRKDIAFRALKREQAL